MEEHPEAREIVETLSKAGFVAYYAGGWVRDFLLKHPSDDIDIATNAPPETIRALFPHTVPIGIAFGILLVIVNGRPYEVATFRRDLDYHDGRRPSRVEFSTAQEDAQRRDFTINGMFYDPLNEKILDYVQGEQDLKAKIIRAIGNPHERIREDRLRMIRAIRLSCRFGFAIEPKTQDAIRAHASELFPSVAIERIWQEFSKGHAFGKLAEMLSLLYDFHLLQTIFPLLNSPPFPQIRKYPKEAPVIAFILGLFPNAPHLDLCERLKASRLDAQFAEYLFEIRQDRPKDLVAWAHLYASPFRDISLQIAAAHEGPAFLLGAEKRIALLQKAIARIQSKTPVVSASDLLKEGVPAGKSMGILLKEAEKISIHEGIDEPDAILSRLKKLPIWPI